MLLICYGTRPEYIKIYPVISALHRVDINMRTLFTGQHADMLKCKEADIKYVINASINGANRLNSICSQMLVIPDEVFSGITAVMVQGDTASAFILSLNAFHRQIPVIHLEAGLRTFDMMQPYPEELYRQTISKLATLHLCPTEENKKNLLQEKITSNIYVTGNSGLDNLVQMQNLVTYDNLVLITLHRRENLSALENWFKALNQLAINYPTLRFIFPMHLNPSVQHFRHLLTRVSVVDPLEHHDLLLVLQACCMVISDSGGLQEESCYLRKKIIICRAVTERPECLGLNGYLCSTPDMLGELFEQLIKMPQPEPYVCPFGDGDTSKQIAHIIKTFRR